MTGFLNLAGVTVGGRNPQDIRVSDRLFFKSVLADPELKLGETYMDGMWESDAIDQLIYRILMKRNSGSLDIFMPLFRAPHLLLTSIFINGFRYFRDAITNRQTRELSKTVAENHYDAGNDLYRQMLDPTMTYTSGMWAPGYTLEDAQNAKYDVICRKLGIKPGDHILDIGSGFGGFARFAAKNYGARVTGITISIEQLKAARALSTEFAGVDFVFSDYRDISHRFAPNTFDHVVSIEMIEAVGVKNLDEYFRTAQASLKPHGRFLIQAINGIHDVVGSNAFFSKYIFSNGVAPSNGQVDRAARRYFGNPIDRQRMTSDYDRTLMAWHANFENAWPSLKSRYGERFKRMWDFYLLSIAGAFRAKQVQLDQTVFVKGGVSTDLPSEAHPLPSMERLLALRQTEAQKARTRFLIEALENERIRRAEKTIPRPRDMLRPLHRDARIAVIGAGPGGLSSAAELRALGFTNVAIFEKNEMAGGKSHTLDFDGRAHDLGATMGIRLKYGDVVKLATEQGQVTIPFPPQVEYELATGMPRPPLTIRTRLQVAYQALVYMIRHRKLTGKDGRGLEIPPDDLSDPWQLVMDRDGMGQLGDQMKTYLTGYGYGGPETPAVYAHRMLDVDAILGAALSQPIMWKNGTQPIWTGLAETLGVQTNSGVTRVERDTQGAWLFFDDGRPPERFDKVMIAVDPLLAIQLLDATPEERDVFQLVQHMPYSTFAVRVEGLSAGKSEVGYLRENMTLDRQGHPMAWIKRYADDNLFIFHLFAPQSMSDDQIMANIERDMKRIGATKLELIDSRRWPFFPHVDAAAMREHRFFERASALQGKNHTVFVNEALGMSTMPDVARLGKNAADRLASGEYGYNGEN